MGPRAERFMSLLDGSAIFPESELSDQVDSFEVGYVT